MKIDRRNELFAKGLELAEVGNYDWKIAKREAERIARQKLKPTWDRQGLHDIAEVAIREFEEKTGVQLPYNLATHGPYVWASWSRRYSLDERGKEIVEETARFCGWIRAAMKFSILVRLFERTTSPNGVNSPHTVIDLWEFVKRHPSPGRTARRLAQIRRRANQVLEAYGLQVSWEALGNVRGLGNIGKSARKAAGFTVRQFLARSKNSIGYFETNKDLEVLIKARGLQEFLQANPASKGWTDDNTIQLWAFDRVNAGEFASFREALANSSRLIKDDTDGVKVLIDPKSTEFYHGIKIVKGWKHTGYLWLITWGHLSYHAPIDDLRMGVKAAMRAWKKQAEMERMEEEDNQELVAKLQPSDRCLLVRPEDSWSAGNCKPGTEAWMKQEGLSGKHFVGVHVLFPHINDNRVRRVLQVVAERSIAAD